MKVLVACEFSGIVRDAFIARGHTAVSCDLVPSERPGPHYQGDVRDLITDDWDMLIAHPPCTYLSRVSMCRPNPDWAKVRVATDFVLSLWEAPIARIAIENPVGRLNKLWQLPTQMIQPWAFGDPWTKKTCLWLKNLPSLMATACVQPNGSWVNAGKGSKGVAMHAKDRSRTFPGIALAMADQWGVL